jgi:WD40 repeat protein
VATNDNYAVTALAVSDDGRLMAAGGRAGAATVWRMRNRTRVHTLRDADAATGDTSSLKFSSDGRTLAAGDSGGSILLWDAVTGEGHGGALRLSEASIETLSFVGGDRMLVSGDSNGNVVLWDLTSPPRLGRRLPGAAFPVESAEFSPDGLRIAMLSNGPSPSPSHALGRSIRGESADAETPPVSIRRIHAVVATPR